MPKSSKRTDTCPLCRSPQSPEYAPFCSRGCKDRDLLKWLGGGYSIPGPPAEERDLMPRVDSEDGDG
ncbi:hypothetical protein GCM10022276_21920 [Sphingomonas limnosediminicola]|uniref:DNA gyrase inhibitor YacG n=1 Tax=Sphingomonas limnosediminicola TaxID=940133 RepID=A0ABP7LIX9_9SPHN